MEIEHPAYVSHASCLSVLLHLRKRLRDEYGVDVTPEWEMRVVDGEHDIPLPRTQVLEEREACVKIAESGSCVSPRPLRQEGFQLAQGSIANQIRSRK